MSESGAIAITLLVLWVLASIVLGGLFAIARRGRREPYDEERTRTPAPWPARYAGCRTCEGAEIAGRAALIRHQNADHTGGILWR